MFVNSTIIQLVQTRTIICDTTVVISNFFLSEYNFNFILRREAFEIFLFKVECEYA